MEFLGILAGNNEKMKKHKLLTLLGLVLCLSFSPLAKAQDREDAKPITFLQKSPKLTKFMGWFHSTSSGKWVSHTNFVADDGFDPGRSPAFNWLQTASFEHNGKKYYVILYQHPDGYYKYPTLHQDWVPVTTMAYIVLDVVRYGTLVKGLEKDGRTNVVAKRYSTSMIGNAETDVPKCIAAEFAKKADAFVVPSYENDSIFVDVQTVKGKKVVRFDPTAYLTSIVYKRGDAYFEADYADFKAAILPMSAAEQAEADKAIKESSPEAQAAKLQAEADAQKADSIAKVNAAIAMITNWKSSDTLRASSAKWMAANKFSKDALPFSWLVFVTFNFKGEKKFAVCYQQTEAAFKGETNIVIYDEKQYLAMKKLLEDKAGTDLFTKAQYACRVPKGQADKETKLDIATNLLDRKKYESDYCFGLYAKKKSAKFSLPMAYCSMDAVGEGSTWQSYDYNVEEFIRLFSVQ